MLPRIGITAGDPAGIGPEIARKAMNDPRVRAVCEPLFYGAQDRVRAGRALRRSRSSRVRDDRAGSARRAGRRRFRALPRRLSTRRRSPLAGLPWRGHTEMLASLTDAPKWR